MFCNNINIRLQFLYYRNKLFIINEWNECESSYFKKLVAVVKAVNNRALIR